MDFWGFLMFFFLAFLIMSCCGYCCSTKRRGAVLSTPVVVTSTSHTAPGGYPVTQTVGGYPVTQMPAPGGYQQTNIYAYPQQGAPGQMQMPMPMPMAGVQPPAPGMQPHMMQYQPMANTAANMNPPSYDAAIAGVSSGQPSGQQNNASYEKQSAYNPNYSSQ